VGAFAGTRHALREVLMINQREGLGALHCCLLYL
jgi:hypothetical protein